MIAIVLIYVIVLPILFMTLMNSLERLDTLVLIVLFKKRKRLLYPEKSHKISFDDFQVIFLKAAHLSYYVNACISQCRDSELDKIDSVEIINLPNGKKAGVTVFREFDVNRFGLEIYPS